MASLGSRCGRESRASHRPESSRDAAQSGSAKYGKKIDQEYRSLLKEVQKSKEAVNSTEKDEDLVQFDDDLVLRILKETRADGYHSYVLDQSPNLCLGYTREDILIVKPED